MSETGCAAGERCDDVFGDPEAVADAQELARLCKALAHPTRVLLVRYLVRYGACYFGDLSELVGMAASTTSQHVKVLKEAGILLASAEEQRMCYCVAPDRLEALRRLIGAL